MKKALKQMLKVFKIKLLLVIQNFILKSLFQKLVTKLAEISPLIMIDEDKKYMKNKMSHHLIYSSDFLKKTYETWRFEIRGLLIMWFNVNFTHFLRYALINLSFLRHGVLLFF